MNFLLCRRNWLTNDDIHLMTDGPFDQWELEMIFVLANQKPPVNPTNHDRSRWTSLQFKRFHFILNLL